MIRHDLFLLDRSKIIKIVLFFDYYCIWRSFSRVASKFRYAFGKSTPSLKELISFFKVFIMTIKMQWESVAFWKAFAIWTSQSFNLFKFLALKDRIFIIGFPSRSIYFQNVQLSGIYLNFWIVQKQKHNPQIVLTTLICDIMEFSFEEISLLNWQTW